MTNHQTKVHEQIQRIVKRGTTDRKKILVNLFTQLLNGKMAIETIHRIKHRKALRRLTEFILVQIFG